jgi:hypothetical protein
MPKLLGIGWKSGWFVTDFKKFCSKELGKITDKIGHSYKVREFWLAKPDE